MTIEICAGNLQSALNAQIGGAHRIELCAALDLGGLTPSAGLIRATLQSLDIPVMVLIRPREGHFRYRAEEADQMLQDVAFCREAGAAGVVVGALDESGNLDLPLLQALKHAAGPLQVCCHRAFDYVNDPFAALEQLIALHFDRILSSGGAPDAWTGRKLLQELVAAAFGRISIMPGAGIHPGKLRLLAEATGAVEFHASAKRRVTSPSDSQALPGLDESYQESDVEQIRMLLLESR